MLGSDNTPLKDPDGDQKTEHSDVGDYFWVTRAGELYAWGWGDGGGELGEW